jgi:hypothetical protein
MTMSIIYYRMLHITNYPNIGIGQVYIIFLIFYLDPNMILYQTYSYYLTYVLIGVLGLMFILLLVTDVGFFPLW